MNLKYAVILIALLALFCFAPMAQAVTLDDFSDTNVAMFALLTAPGTQNYNDLGVTGVAGGDRRIEYSASAASSLVNSVGFEVALGNAAYASGPMADGSLKLLYDGATLGSDLGFVDDILLDFLNFDLASSLSMPVTVTVSDGVNSASGVVTLMSSFNVLTTFVLDLDTLPGIGLVNRNNLASVLFEFEPGVGADFTLAGLRTQVPEPSSFVFGAVAVMAAGGFGWRRRRQL